MWLLVVLACSASLTPDQCTIGHASWILRKEYVGSECRSRMAEAAGYHSQMGGPYLRWWCEQKLPVA